MLGTVESYLSGLPFRGTTLLTQAAGFAKLPATLPPATKLALINSVPTPGVINPATGMVNPAAGLVLPGAIPPGLYLPAPMPTSTKVAIGVGIAAAVFLGWKFLKRGAPTVATNPRRRWTYMPVVKNRRRRRR